jgi:DNA-binding MarR family transcriptional regulator
MALSEREALNIWRDVIVDSVRSDTPDLTARQQALLLTVCLSAGPHTVRGLAEQLNITKPAITRGVDALEKLKLVRRVPDQQDLRNVFIERTPEGTTALRHLAERIQACMTASDAPKDTPARAKKAGQKVA